MPVNTNRPVDINEVNESIYAIEGYLDGARRGQKPPLTTMQNLLAEAYLILLHDLVADAGNQILGTGDE